MTRIEHEIEHGKKLKTNAESIWGWSSPVGISRANRRASYYAQLGNWNKESNLLEIGCGTGLFTRKVYSTTQANITAIDISEDLLEIARDLLPQANFKQADAMHLEFKDDFFDGVYGSSVLHHLDMEKSLKEIYRVLKPQGRIVFAEPNMLNPQIFIQKNIPFIKRLAGDSPDETAVVRWKMVALLKQLGFKKARVFPYDFLHPITPKPLINIVSEISKALEQLPLIKEIAGSHIIYAEK